MARPIIEAKKLSKKYRIGHQESYLALRDRIAEGLRKPFTIFSRKKTVSSSSSSREDFWALRDISFNVSQGEVVGVIGRNGAGKTTLLKIFSRITYPTEGEIRMRGRVGSLLEVGTGFHPELTGRENIYFNGSILGMKKREIDKNFDAIVDFSGVEKFIDTPVKRFSSGMQVRLAFSVAAHLDPEILLVDEVLAVGDVKFQQKCLGKMKEVAKGGRTVLFVSHNMSAITKLCGRTLLLEQGKLVMDGDTQAVVAKYLDQNLTAGASISSKDIEKKLEGYINRRNPSICFKEIALFNKEGSRCSVFNSDEPVNISITYECLSIVTGLRVNVYIVDEENKVILATQNIDNHDEVEFYQRKPGTYRSSCTISPNLFGERRFYVSVHLEYPKVEHLVLDKILGFDVIFQGYNDAPASLKDAFMRPQLKWKTDFIEEKETIHG